MSITNILALYTGQQEACNSRENYHMAESVRGEKRILIGSQSGANFTIRSAIIDRSGINQLVSANCVFNSSHKINSFFFSKTHLTTRLPRLESIAGTHLFKAGAIIINTLLN